MSLLSRRSLGAAFAGLTAGTALARTGLGASPADLGNVVLRIGDQTGTFQPKLGAAGLLDDVPYKIAWSVYPAAVQLHEALKADAIDIGWSADSPAVSAMAGGSPIKIVAAWGNDALGSQLLVPKGSPIETIQDLRGKTISPSTRGSIAHYLVLGVLKKAGIRQDEVKLAFLVPADASAAFQAGSIDAWATWTIYVARAVGRLGARSLLNGKGINSGIDALSARQDILTDPLKVAALADYVERIQRGFDWSRNNPEIYNRFFAQFAKQDLDIAEAIYPAEAAYRRVPADDGLVAILQKTHDTWVEAGVLTSKLDLNAYVFRGLNVS